MLVRVSVYGLLLLLEKLIIDGVCMEGCVHN